jgi:hypothetical protein
LVIIIDELGHISLESTGIPIDKAGILIVLEEARKLAEQMRDPGR